MYRHTLKSGRRGLLMGCAAALLALLAIPALAQDTETQATPEGDTTNRVAPQPVVFQNFRPHDARGLNMFETPKDPGVPYTGFEFKFGGAFAQDWQGLSQENNANPKMVNNVDANQLMDVGNGFTNAMANLYIDSQLARGIRVAMSLYLSTRHHRETWVKDGYLLVDASPYRAPVLDDIMKYVSLKLGHFEVNYGDAHFRRTDAGNGMYNPFVGNLLMDAFTTEIGAEAYFRAHGLLAMAGVTGGEIRGDITKPEQRDPSYLAKLGFDKQVAPGARVRLTGSLYTTDNSISNTLYSGSRAGSHYFFMMENTQASESGQAWSGDVQPGFKSNITAWVVNPFVKVGGLELFGNYEVAAGRADTETSKRWWHQYAGEGVYRFLDDALYVAGRYNVAKGEYTGIPNDVTVDRLQLGGGWFITPNVLAKAEYVKQTYSDFPMDDIRCGGKFSGMMVEGVVAF